MGVVSKQASISTIYSYIGVVIGFVNVAILMNRFFSTEENGLVLALLNIALIYTQLSHLGSYRSLVKFHPFFDRGEKTDNGLLSIGLSLSLIGFLSMGLLIILFKDLVISLFVAKSPMFVEYFYFIFPLSFFLLFNNIFETYLQAKLSTIFASFLKLILNRLLVSILLVLFYFKIIDFYQFLVIYVFLYSINVLLFIIYLKKEGHFNLKINFRLFNRRIRKVFLNYSLFSILSGASGVIAARIDGIMIISMLGLTQNAIYLNAFNFTVLMSIPADAIAKIAFPVISDKWKKKNMDAIDEIYKKSSINQYLIGGVLLLMLWINMDSVFQIQRDEYAAGKYVLLILGIGKLIHLLFGVNGQIISISKYYKFDTLVLFFLGIMTVVTNLIFIPIWGIMGAAFATALSLVIFNIIRYLFIYFKLGIQPFGWEVVKISVFLCAGFLTNLILPVIDNIYLDILYRTIIIGLITGVPIYLSKVSEDTNKIVDNLFKKIGLKQ